jgi:hypothetical protein
MLRFRSWASIPCSPHKLVCPFAASSFVTNAHPTVVDMPHLISSHHISSHHITSHRQGQQCGVAQETLRHGTPAMNEITGHTVPTRTRRCIFECCSESGPLVLDHPHHHHQQRQQQQQCHVADLRVSCACVHCACYCLVCCIYLSQEMQGLSLLKALCKGCYPFKCFRHCNHRTEHLLHPIYTQAINLTACTQTPVSIIYLHKSCMNHQLHLKGRCGINSSRLLC